ncbi:MAG: glycoside hydrolase family protein [Anaerolineae bacterium]
MDLTKVQLFADDALIEETYRLGRVVHRPEKYSEPIIVPDRPWEGLGLFLWGTAMYDQADRRFKMWYQTLFSLTEPEKRRFICYATSSDGIHWEKPGLGQVDFDGSRDNNIVVDPGPALDSPSVVYDPGDEDASRRYKMIYRAATNGTTGLYAAFSPDGIAWTKVPDPVAPGHGDRTNAMFSRGLDGKLVVLTRKPDMMKDYNTRCVYRIDSDDFIHWSPAQLVMKPDLGDSPNLQFYSMTGFVYGDQYLGVLERMHAIPDVLDEELTVSRDGKQWQRVDRTQVFLAREKEWEGNWVHVASNPPVEYRGRLWWFYCGRHLRHGASYPNRESRIGVATSRIDGFVSIEGGPEEGRLLTIPVTWPGGDLAINADTRTGAADFFRLYGGTLRVAVLDGEGHEVSGFGLKESIPFVGDTENRDGWQAYHLPRWTSGRTPAELQGQTVKLAFYLKNARLYSIRATGA